MNPDEPKTKMDKAKSTLQDAASTAAKLGILYAAVKHAEKEYDAEDRRREERAKLKWWQWLNPKVFVRWWLDQF